jgi:hypothetical protein
MQLCLGQIEDGDSFAESGRVESNGHLSHQFQNAASDGQREGAEHGCYA